MHKLLKFILDFIFPLAYNIKADKFAAMAQMVEHILGKDEVTGSIPVSSSRKNLFTFVKRFFYLILAESLNRISPTIKNTASEPTPKF